MNYLYNYQVQLISYFYSYYDFESFVYINNILCILSKNNFIKNICQIICILYIAKTKKKKKQKSTIYNMDVKNYIQYYYVIKLLENIDIIELLTYIVLRNYFSNFISLSFYTIK